MVRSESRDPSWSHVLKYELGRGLGLRALGIGVGKESNHIRITQIESQGQGLPKQNQGVIMRRKRNGFCAGRKQQLYSTNFCKTNVKMSSVFQAHESQGQVT